MSLFCLGVFSFFHISHFWVRANLTDRRHILAFSWSLAGVMRKDEDGGELRGEGEGRWKVGGEDREKDRGWYRREDRG